MRDFSDQLLDYMIDKTEAIEFLEGRKDPHTIPEFQKEIRLLAKRQNKAGEVIDQLIQKPLDLLGVNPVRIYKLILLWPAISSGKWDVKSTRGRATWARLMYKQLDPALSIPDAADYLSQVVRCVFGETYRKKSIQQVLWRTTF